MMSDLPPPSTPVRPSQPGPDSDARNAVGLVAVLGNAAQMVFGRLYQRNLNAKPASPTASDPAAVLRAANRELSARVKTSELLNARLRAVFASLSEGVVMQNSQGRVVLINHAAEDLLGSMKNFWDSDLGKLYRTSQERQTGDSEMELLGAPTRVQINDRIVGAQLAAVFSPEGTRIGTVIVLRDVTREALADRLKDEFVSQVTHELRTPLTAIKGMSEVLLNQPTDRPPNRKFLEAIGRNAAVLDRMIIELLDISEISAGSFAIQSQRLALDELVLAVIQGQAARIKKQNLNVGMMVVNRAHLQVMGDDRRLRWALGHLFDNSLNYTLNGGLITFRIGAVQGDRVLIEVSDTGVGINARDLPHVFERFYRGEAKTPDGKVIDPRGLGQGLYVARSVAEAHDGYLTASSQPGVGSTFTLGLPFAPDEIEPVSATASEAPSP
ncbi:MAG: sensor histidine kinase [Aggregatilineales bacterium]